MIRRARALAALSFALTGCTAVLGVKDIYLDENAAAADGGGLDDAQSDGPGAVDGSPSDGGTCNADLTTDPKNCGRCGHDCAGGACAAGKCEPVTLATGLTNPTALALDGANVYVTVRNDNSVIVVPKAGGAPKVLASGQTAARGVVVDNGTLYWSNGDYPYDDAGAVGGVWKCALPACAQKELLAKADWAFNVTLANGWLYYSANNAGEVRRVMPSGTGDMVIGTTNHAFGVAADDAYVYYTSSQPNVYRARVDGGSVGTEESVGPLDSSIVGFITVDADRFYWAYVDTGGKGHVLSASKSDPAGPKTTYGSDAENVNPVGVGVDATYLYWTTDGTDTGGATNGDGKLFACPKAGCPASGPMLLADKLSFGGPIATDDAAIYWTESGTLNQAGGRVRKVAKP